MHMLCSLQYLTVQHREQVTSGGSTVAETHLTESKAQVVMQGVLRSSQCKGRAKGQLGLSICPSLCLLLPFDMGPLNRHRKYFLANPLWGKSTNSPPEKPSAFAVSSNMLT